MLDRIRNEPALVTGFIRAVLLCVTAFGLELSAEQIAAVMLVAEAGLSLFTRSRVIPMYPDGDEDGATDVSLLLLVGTFIGVVLLLCGVRFDG